MAELETQLFASGLPVEALMEKAALAVSRKVLEALRGSGGCQKALVLVGPGHNGGDGLVVARELHLAGIDVAIWSPYERRKPLTDAHLRHALWLGVPMLEQAPDPADSRLWIDGLFGIAQHRPPGGGLEALLTSRQRQRPHSLVSIDVPTGLCADTGRVLGDGAACCATTYCIGLLKRGLIQDPALAWVGRLERIDLGLPPALLATLPADQPLALGWSDAARGGSGEEPWPRLDPANAKYGRGRALLVAGSSRYRGAAHLALSGATASGCGSLRASLPVELTADLWTIHPHVVLEAPLPRGTAGELDLGTAGCRNAGATGCGAGGTWNRDGAAGGGSGSGHDLGSAVAVPWPAGARCRWTESPGATPHHPWRPPAGVEAWFRQRSGPTWITPHRGEFDRLFPALSPLAPLEAAAAAAAACGIDIVLKGARTVIAAGDGRRWQIRQACPEVARAGLGDVLAGYVTGRGAMGMAASADGGSSLDAALLAASCLDHALAGRAALDNGGDGGTTPQAVAGSLGRINGAATARPDDRCS